MVVYHCVPKCTFVYHCGGCVLVVYHCGGCVYHCGCVVAMWQCVVHLVVCTTVLVVGCCALSVVYNHCDGCGLCTTIAILCRYSVTPTDRQPPFANFFTTPNNLQSLEILWTQGPPHNRWLATLCNFFSLYRQYLYFYFEFRALCHIHGFVSYK